MDYTGGMEPGSLILRISASIQRATRPQTLWIIIIIILESNSVWNRAQFCIIKFLALE